MRANARAHLYGPPRAVAAVHQFFVARGKVRLPRKRAHCDQPCERLAKAAEDWGQRNAVKALELAACCKVVALHNPAVQPGSKCAATRCPTQQKCTVNKKYAC